MTPGRQVLHFDDRRHAGRLLAEALTPLSGQHPVVLGVPRGGVPVAAEVAERLGAPLDVIVVRKLGAPFQPEYGVGAIAEQGVRVLDDAALDELGLTARDLAPVERRERAELARRTERYTGGAGRVDLTGRHVVIVDDGIATGWTARAACRAARRYGAAEVTLAVPVAPRGWPVLPGTDADRLVSLVQPRFLGSVGQWYGDFSPTTDAEVAECLGRGRPRD